MQQYANGYDVIIIDANNVTQYIELPEYIHEKFRRGIIPPAHYSDVIRLALLNRYGGIWIDSTILLTDKLPDYIVNADLFVFRNPQVEGHGQISNPFFAAKPSHPIIESVYRLLLEYWENENKLVSYEIMHLFFSIAVENSKTNEHLWKKVPLVYGSHMYYLLRMLGLNFDEQAYQLVVQLSSIHKLTYKLKQLGIDPEKKGTFYDVLINGNKPI